MAPIPQDAVFATLLMTDSYLPGAMVLGHSLRDRGAKSKLVAFVVTNKLSKDTIAELKHVYDDVVSVQEIRNATPANLYLMDRPDLIATFTKIELWKQTQYSRIVYLDADMVTVRCPNELLTLDTNFAAVPDVGWPDCFNSGMMVLNPNMADYYSLLALAKRGISFDGADQGLLNMHFTDWEKLSFVYNCTPSANYQYVPAYKHFQSSISMIHFIGADKPWKMGRDSGNHHDVFGELLGRWWSVYDRHFRRPKTTYQPGHFVPTAKTTQDFVKGEETIYEPIYQPLSHPQQTYQQQGNRRGSSSGQGQPQGQQSQDHAQHQDSNGYSQPAPPPGIHVTAPAEDRQAMETPFGDQPSHEERIDNTDYHPTPTVEQRRWSAPHAEWEPARQPPPTGSKPEAANFPMQQYEFNESRQLFEPPAQYPDAPKDMWYEVPEKPKPEQRKFVPLFPWEETAPKATRVFPKSREPTPPPADEPATSTQTTATSEPGPATAEPQHTESQPQQSHTASSSEPPPKPPSPPRHIFPWEAHATKATRVFPSDNVQKAVPQEEPQHEQADSNTKTDKTARRPSPISIPPPQDNPWETLQRPNVWDDIPEINKYMESINKPRKAKIQVLHHTPSNSMASSTTFVQGTPEPDRRGSLVTDFPTEEERPSLPVTPAPIRRPSFWGGDQEEGAETDLLAADGVTRPEEWVRRFTSYPLPAFPAHMRNVLRNINGVVHMQCQHCGKQNPIAKLEELQRRQSELVAAGATSILEKAPSPPKRQMPGSRNREEVVQATEKALQGSLPPTKSPLPAGPPKPILREPQFEVTDATDEDLEDEEKAQALTPSRGSPTESRSPLRFSPFVKEGEAASELTGNEQSLLSPTSVA